MNDRKDATLSGLRAGIWGATGATGGELVRRCLADGSIASLLIFTRRPVPLEDPRVEQVIVEDFREVTHMRAELENLDVAFWCLGVSQSAVPQEAKYREITLDYAMAAGAALKEHSPGVTFHFLSGLGADPVGKSRMMWARIKGETEVALAALSLRRLLIWRPAFIDVVGGRDRPSLGERLMRATLPLMRLVPGMTNSTVDIAQAMLEATLESEFDGVVSSRDIRRHARAYRERRRAKTHGRQTR